ncbi:uncharacterized protein TM35_000401510 [Trypanosoma theileri]|uniref:Uncharacterized protein n=1 Tax=Trypanosoma theileri TaxID=67003 RepID=A0A1X0NJD7_9TRYP|nr:uncharacterized protein TM35_000401510 [Trypanosoma theileri]ORC84884.1 hypothetical protein TM35_000401510 [Trypanosoma theileri]
MDTLAYVCRERDANAVRLEVPLISVKATAFSGGSNTNNNNNNNNNNNENNNGEEVPALLASHRKLLCMNMKQPNRLRVLNRKGKYAETDVHTPVLRHLVSSEGHLDHCAFFAVGGSEVVRLRPVNQANGEISIQLRELNLQEELYGVAVGNGDMAYALGRNHVFEVNMETATKGAVIDLTSRTVVKYPVIAYHHETQLLLTPAKSNCLDLISVTTRKSVLPKVWEPHANAVPTAAFFLQQRTFSNEPDGNVYIVTAARGNSELRLWCYNKETRTFSLKQDICISYDNNDTGAANTNRVHPAQSEGENSFLISCTPSEEYITLCSREHAIAVVVQLHRSSFKVDRITSWKLQGPTLSSVATVGKVAESNVSASVEYQVMLTIRTATGFYEEILDVEKLAGASNTAAMKQASIATWFPSVETSGAGAVGDTAVGVPTALTSVSSSVLGDKMTNAVPQSVASRIVRQQALQFCDTLRSIDEGVVGLQKRASEAMQLFQDARAREEAQTIGRKFAVRNKGRLELELEQQQQQERRQTPQTPGTVSAAQKELLEQIHSIVEEVETLTAGSASDVVKALLSRRLKDSVAKGAKEAEQIELSTLVPSIRSTDSMRIFNNGVDAAMRTLVRAIKDHHAMMQTSLSVTTNSSNDCISKAKTFNESLKREMQQLKNELKETIEVVSQVNIDTTPVPVDPDVLVARAVELAEAGEWGTALTVVLEASDITVLLAFLESKVCVDNKATMVSPQTLTLPTFLSLCLQLSFELGEQPGSIPLRIQLLHAFYVEWDDTLKEMKRQAALDKNHQKPMFELTKQELQSVAEQLAAVQDNSIDRRSRNNLRLLKKLIGSLIAE